jgi:glycosyltransferase involved in cell wall biosynthesis
LAASDLFLMPSVLPEGFPVSVVEAMAAGVPVVAADTAGVRAAVDDGRTGLLVRRADPTALAGAVVALLDDDARRRAMGRAGREHASAQLSSEAMLDSFEEALASSALERARGPGRG